MSILSKHLTYFKSFSNRIFPTIKGYFSTIKIESSKNRGSIKKLEALEKKGKEKDISPIIDIPILMSTDEGDYMYGILVGMTSICRSKLNTTKISFYIQVPGEFSTSGKNTLKSVEEYFAHCEVNFVDMGNAFKNYFISRHVSYPTYYRLLAADIFKNIDKMIYLDCDVLAFDDLTSFYNYDMEGLYFRGLLETSEDLNVNYNITPTAYICAGVMLMNLKLIREDNITSKFITFLEEHTTTMFHDQTTINYVCQGKIDGLHPKYCLFCFDSEEDAKRFYDRFPDNRKKSTREVYYEDTGKISANIYEYIY